MKPSRPLRHTCNGNVGAISAEGGMAQGPVGRQVLVRGLDMVDDEVAPGATSVAGDTCVELHARVRLPGCAV